MTSHTRAVSGATGTGEADLRIDLDPENVGRGLAQVVVAVLEVLRELLERQALRRIDAGDLTADQVERLGSALLTVRQQLNELSASLALPDRDPTSVLHRILSDARVEDSGGDNS